MNEQSTEGYVWAVCRQWLPNLTTTIVHRTLGSSSCRRPAEWDTVRHEIGLLTRERFVNRQAQDMAMTWNSWSFMTLFSQPHLGFFVLSYLTACLFPLLFFIPFYSLSRMSVGVVWV